MYMSNTLEGVTCSVKNCKFWESGYHCNASSIEVNVDGGGQSASRSPETNCNTFQPS